MLLIGCVCEEYIICALSVEKILDVHVLMAILHLRVIDRCSHEMHWSCYLFTTRHQHSTMLRLREQPTGVNRLDLVVSNI